MKDNEENFNTSEDEQADDQDREYEQANRMGLSMGNVDIGSSDDEGGPIGLAMPSDGEGGNREFGGLHEDSL